ncbi:MAG: insulinase family protein [Clostridiales bacterium]|nr:insulinase family protein [Clostridiales bacterium]
MEYTDKYYNPVNSVLAISGNFGENIIKKVEKYFGKWENKNITYIRRQSAKYSKAVKKIPKDCEQNHICITFDALNNNDPLAYSTIALNNILGGTMSSRLFQKIREDMGLVYSIYSYVSLYNSEGLLSIYAGMNASNEEKVISAIFKEIKKLMKSSITARELTIAKEQLKSSILFSSDSTESIMNSIGKTMLIRGKIITVEEIYKKIEEISMDKIYEVINKVFNVEDAGIISLGM